jgi:uncharacterized HAD superfamily protein
MTTFTRESAERLIMTRYYSDQIREDTSINELYKILNELSQEELISWNKGDNKLLTKEMLIAKCIEKSIEKFYNFIKEIPYSRRKITEARKSQIFYEKTYWKDIASGVPENEAKEYLNLSCS